MLAAGLLVLLALPTPPFEGCPAQTGSSATLLLPSQPGIALPSGPVEPGDVVAIYTQAGTCVGSGVWTGAGLAVAAWADDPYTTAVDGFVAGDRPEIRVYDASTATTYAGADVVSTFEDGFGLDGDFSTNRVYAVREAPPSAPADVWISEVDALADGGGSFVEIQTSAPGAVLPALTLAAFGPSGERYGALVLTGLRTDAQGLLVVRPDGASGGAGDAHMTGTAAFATEVGAFALYAGPAPAQASGTPIDAAVYGRPGTPRSSGLLQALGQSVQVVDGPSTSVSRPGAGRLLYDAAATPGAANASAVTVGVSGPDDAVGGFRLVSAPVLSASGAPMTVADMAQLNPVQGVPGGAAPGATPTLWTGFDASGQFVAPESVGAAIAPGRGFLWLGAPPPGQTFRLVQQGQPLDDASTGGPYAWSVTATAPDGHYLVGNPYAYPLRLAGVSVGGATLQTAFATWDPVDGTYVDLFADPDDPGASDVLPVWAGALAEVSAVSASAFTVVTTSALVDPTAVPAVGSAVRPRTATAAPMLSFEVVGALASGVRVVDRSAHVRFVEGAGPAWDVHDAAKLRPPSAAYALLAPVGVRRGESLRQRVLSLAPGATATVPLAFAASEAGAFVVRWTLPSLPAGQTAELVDLATGERVNMASASEHAFETTGPAAWADRFEARIAGATTAAEPVVAHGPVVGQPSPNPSTGPVRLAVRPETAQRVVVDVYDATGRRVLQAFDGAVPAGGGPDVEIGLRGMSAGLYVVRVTGETFVETRRVTALR